MYNSLVINENLDKESHSEDAIKGIAESTNLIEAINYSTLYKSIGKLKFETYIKNLIFENNVEVIFFGIGGGLVIDIFFLKELSENFDVKIIIAFPDSEHLFEDIDRYYAQAADLVCVNNPDLEKIFNIYGIPTFCGLGFDTERYNIQSINKSIDVSFIGGINRGHRKEYIDFLIANGVNVEIAGHGSERGIISTKEKKIVTWKTKVNLNFTGILNNDREIYKRIKGSKGRAQEISLLGGFVLSEYASGLEGLFDIGNEIDVFHTKEEMLKKITFYLQNNTLRETMAFNANKKALIMHDTSTVVKRLLVSLENLSIINNKTYYIDAQFAYLFSSFRFYYMIISLLNGNYRSAGAEFSCILKYKHVRFKNFFYDIPRAFYHHFKSLFEKNKKGFE